jgi:glycosyltransferase involved in cell wall biosynthesis
VPYRERHNYLLTADLGVSAHFDTVESTFAYRTRLLDYVWAGLPIVTTRGDPLARLVTARRLGRAVDFEDADAYAEAILGLLDDEGEYKEIQGNLAALRLERAWSEVVRPLVDLIEDDRARRPARAETSVLLADYAQLRARLSLLRLPAAFARRDGVSA